MVMADDEPRDVDVWGPFNESVSPVIYNKLWPNFTNTAFYILPFNAFKFKIGGDI
jgi:hypothetical protein